MTRIKLSDPPSPRHVRVCVHSGRTFSLLTINDIRSLLGLDD